MAIIEPPVPSQQYVPASTPGSEHPWDPFGAQLILFIGRDENETVFKITESTLTHYSGSFKSLTSSSYLFDNKTGHIRLPGEDPKVFGLALNYLLNRSLSPAPELSFDDITTLFSLGTRRHIPLIHNIALDLFATKIHLSRTLPSPSSTMYLWESTSSGSSLRRLLIDLVREMFLPGPEYRSWVWRELVGGKSEDCERLVWVMVELKRDVRVSKKMMSRVKSCGWHVHEEGVFCEGSEEFRLGVGGLEGEGEGRKRKWSSGRE